MAALSRGDVHLIVAIFLGALIAVQAWDVSDTTPFAATWGSSPTGTEDVGGVADAIFEIWVVPFEVLSVLLLVALVAAVAIATKGRGGEGPMTLAEYHDQEEER